MRTVWILAATMCLVTTLAALVAFRHSTDRSLIALMLWGAVALALVAPLVYLRGLISPAPPDERTINVRALRFVILAYLPLQCALLLLIVERW
jgi:hypothetical protein